jgi:hypothetical protein
MNIFEKHSIKDFPNPAYKYESKETEWCPQHGYPLPCNKCGLGEREAGRQEVIDWVNENIEMTAKRNDQWQNKLKEWGIE